MMDDKLKQRISQATSVRDSLRLMLVDQHVLIGRVHVFLAEGQKLVETLEASNAITNANLARQNEILELLADDVCADTPPDPADFWKGE